MKKPFLIYLLSTIAATTIAAQTGMPAPRLVVGITVDQLRSDYLEKFSSFYSEDGLKRLLRDGVIYSHGQYSSSNIDRASAVASIYTGTVPYQHGIIGSEWMDRKVLQLVHPTCEHLLVSTIGDELKIATDGRAYVYGVGTKNDEAVLSAGHAADGAVWRGEGGSCSVSAFERSQSSLLSQIKAHDANSNEWVASVATELLNRTELGKDEVPDLLTLNFATGVEGDFTTQSVREVELQNAYVRLDNALTRVLCEVDRKIGAANVLVFLTSTGYEAEREANLASYRVPTGVFQMTRCTALLNMYLGALYGEGQYIDATYYNNVYLNRQLIEKKQLALSNVLASCEDFLFQYKGVRDVYTSSRITLGAWTPGISSIRNAYNPKCSGDIIIEINQGWTLDNEKYGQRRYVRDSYFEFPIIFYGLNLKPQTIAEPISIEYIAPTVARYMRIRAPNACDVAPLRVNP